MLTGFGHYYKLPLLALSRHKIYIKERARAQKGNKIQNEKGVNYTLTAIDVYNKTQHVFTQEFQSLSFALLERIEKLIEVRNIINLSCIYLLNDFS